MLLPGAGARPDCGVSTALIGSPVLLAALLGVIGCRYLCGNDAPPAPIATDRPAVTDSSIVVPLGSLQAENGFAETVNQGQRTWDGPETLLRFGVASKTELRFTAPDYFGGASGMSGLGDLAVGLKRQLGPAHGFDASLVLSLSVPAGATAVSSHGYDPFAQLPWSRTLSPNWTVAGMLSVYWPSQAGHRNVAGETIHWNVTGETTFLLDRQLTTTWDTFVEYAGDFPEAGGPRHLLHFGTTYKVRPQQQLDLHVGVGLSSAAVDHFIGIGYSFRLQAVRR